MALSDRVTQILEHMAGDSVYSTAALSAGAVIKASAGVLHGIMGHNNNGSAQYIQIHNTKTLVADTAVPIAVIAVPANSNFSIDFGYGLTCSTGITWCNSSTLATKTIGAADCFVTAIYK
jgi:hypothetical protein